MDLLSLAAQLIAFLLAFLVLIVIVVILKLLFGRTNGTQTWVQNGQELHPKEEETSTQTEEIEHSYDEFEPVERFEILYWRGVEETWRWNSFAEDLIKYATENLPHKYLEFYTYNSSRQAVGYDSNAKRIEQLRLKKIRRFPLVSINYDKEIYSIDSSYKFNQICKRIDAEWERHYGLI